jgi:hypothetical protein
MNQGTKGVSDGNAGAVAEQLGNQQIPTLSNNVRGALEQYLRYLTPLEARPFLPLLESVPYVIGDLIVRPLSGFDLLHMDSLHLPVQNIDQFKNIDFHWSPSTKKFNQLKEIPEQQVKELFCRLLGEAVVPKDWGGEECDIFSSNLSVDGKKCIAAFLLKGPAKFHEMTMVDCGKNGDQIYRLFNTPADVFVIQHCHTITTAVRKTVEAFTLAQYSRSCRYTIIDGYDTARILHSNGIL